MNDKVVYAEATTEERGPTVGAWKILIVDDEHEVHDVTKLALADVVFDGKPIEFIDAYSGKEAEELILTHPDLAIILLDVVMEDDETGLRVVEFIRKTANRHCVRIILRTGQPGHAPERNVVINYDINDYKAKTELTAQKLLTSIISALRAYDHLNIIEANQVEIRGLYSELTEYSGNLEKMVEDRTQELVDLNANLERLVQEKSKLLVRQEKSAIVGRLLQGFVHNLRSPLTAIRGISYLIHVEAARRSDEVINERSLKIDEICKGMNAMMERLMAKSRMDQVDLRKPININNLIKNELELLEAHSVFKNQIHKEYIFDESLPDIPLVYSDISQVLHNLIHNAMDAMFGIDNPKLTIRTRQNETLVYIDVVDTGCGITENEIELIFDPFYTTKPAEGDGGEETDKPTGTGLGLHTCLGLLKSVGGRITVESQSDHGSVFTVNLPKVDSGLGTESGGPDF